jgi:hypothetical protein
LKTCEYFLLFQGRQQKKDSSEITELKKSQIGEY